MNPEAMKLFGQALLDYHKGDLEATITLKRDDGNRVDHPVKVFFRDAQEYALEKIALDLCYGRVLDIGAGSGIHSLFLQDKGLDVKAIDISPKAVQVMRERGVVNVHLADIMSFEEDQFDTILMMGQNIGIAETINGLSQYLQNVSHILNIGGQVFLTSVDVQYTDDPVEKQYQEQNLESGRYFGEVRMKVIYKGMEGLMFGWMRIDPETLNDYALEAGLNCEVIKQHEDGGYLARLSHQ